MSQTSDSAIPGAEEEEEDKKTGRSAFFAGVHKGGDSYSGAFRGVPSTPHGGAASVRPEDTLGAEDLCWCGKNAGHPWPGKDRGVKHPRGDEMSAVADEKPYLNPRALKAWDVKVVKALCALVNTYGINYRIDRNQMHVYLDSPGGEQEVAARLKAGRSRPPEQMLSMIEKWAEKYVRPAKVEEALPKLAGKFNDPTKKPHEKAAVKASTSEPVPEPTQAPQPPQTLPDASPEVLPEGPLEFKGDEEADSLDALMAPPGFEQWFSSRGHEPLNWWKKIGADVWTCKTCDNTVTDAASLGGHQRAHTVPMEDKVAHALHMNERTPEELSERSAKGGKTRQIRRLYEIIEEVTGQPPTKGRDQSSKVAKLEAALAKVTAERDDLKAKLDLMKDLMRS